MNVNKFFWVIIAFAILHTSSSRRKSKCDGQYRCKRSTEIRKCNCIDKSQLCNGENDCPGRDDEEGCRQVNGLWSDWQSWGTCAGSCGSGSRMRFRTCTNPIPSGGAGCAGDPAEAMVCELKACPVNGMWGDWTGWSLCSEPCGGGGTKTRTRTCTCPPQSDGGTTCVGESVNNESCGTQTCPQVVCGPLPIDNCLGGLTTTPSFPDSTAVGTEVSIMCTVVRTSPNVDSVMCGQDGNWSVQSIFCMSDDG